MEFTDEVLKSHRYIHGDVFSFLRQGSASLDIRLSDTMGKHKYSLTFTDQMKLTGGGKILAGPSPIPGVELDPHWIPFWVDMRKTGRIVVGTGSTMLINFTATDGEVFLPFLKFHVTVAGEQIIYCNKKGV